ncbi:MAG TPA: toll/interleukin-1 receptor domain-containing protein, partial [Ktedonobacterales bacterium]|nr:toll/interleukin-1 receptor domain-containing protein [Ktedonobacterales bacterium]
MNLPAQRHVFISYSRADSDFAARLIRDLEARGIGVWIDVDGLQPGTSNWETSIRAAISQAFALIFVASPNSAQSGPVHGELSIAGDSNKTILPVWATGDHWSSCAPFDMMRAQYIDLRADQYAANLDQLIAAIEQQRPAHMILDGDAPPQGYFKVALGDFGDQTAIAFKDAAFPTMRQFADTLYTAYLRDRLAP